MRETFGVDIGGVIISRMRGASDTSFHGENYLETPAVPGTFDAIAQLVRERFGERVFLVSKCGPRVQAKTLRWLEHHGFYQASGVQPKHIRFCPEREDKAEICRELGVTHFIDDRLDVLLKLRSVAYRYQFVPEPGASRPRASARVAPLIRVVTSWGEILRELLPPPRLLDS